MLSCWTIWTDRSFVTTVRAHLTWRDIEGQTNTKAPSYSLNANLSVTRWGSARLRACVWCADLFELLRNANLGYATLAKCTAVRAIPQLYSSALRSDVKAPACITHIGEITFERLVGLQLLSTWHHVWMYPNTHQRAKMAFEVLGNGLLQLQIHIQVIFISKQPHDQANGAPFAVPQQHLWVSLLFFRSHRTVLQPFSADCGRNCQLSCVQVLVYLSLCVNIYLPTEAKSYVSRIYFTFKNPLQTNLRGDTLLSSIVNLTSKMLSRDKITGYTSVDTSALKH